MVDDERPCRARAGSAFHSDAAIIFGMQTSDGRHSNCLALVH
jgi:hypothetical protein